MIVARGLGRPRAGAVVAQGFTRAIPRALPPEHYAVSGGVAIRLPCRREGDEKNEKYDWREREEEAFLVLAGWV